MTVHVAGLAGLVVIFVIATLRPVNLGVLALAATFLVGTFVAGASGPELLAGFPVRLLVLLTGVTICSASRRRTARWRASSTAPRTWCGTGAR